VPVDSRLLRMRSRRSPIARVAGSRPSPRTAARPGRSTGSWSRRGSP